MAQREILLPWTSQPQEAVEPHIGIPFHTLLTPVGGSAIEAATAGAAWRTIAGPLWTASGVSGVSRAVAPFGLALAQTGSDYFYRDNPISSGPRSWGMVFVPSSVSGVHGLWSIAATPNSGGPRFLLQRNGSDIRFYHSSGYRATFSGAAVVGRPVYIAWSLSDTFGGATSCTMTVALNGEVQSYTGTTALASDAYEYLGNGYNGSAQGFYGEFWGVESELSSDQLQALSIEQSFWGGIYAPQTIQVPVSAGGATTHATTGALEGAGAAIDGAAAHIAKHATSGVLAGSGGSVDGAAARTRAHPTSGVLAGGGASIAGTARHNVPHAASGVLAGGGGAIDGAADHVVPGGTHDTSGALQGGGGAASGTAAHVAVHGTSGALVGAGGAVDGDATRVAAAVTHATSGALVGGGGVVDGAASGPIVVSDKVGGDDVPRIEIYEKRKKKKRKDETLEAVIRNAMRGEPVEVKADTRQIEVELLALQIEQENEDLLALIL